MKKETKSPKMLRQRKLYMILPLLVVPFVTLLFWALGGGSKADEHASLSRRKGLDLTLPTIQSGDEDYLSKMDYYHQAALDSTKRREQIKSDPYYNDTVSLQNTENGDRDETSLMTDDNINSHRELYSHFNDPNEAKVYQKLAQLDAVLNTADTIPGISPNEAEITQHPDTEMVPGSNIDRLEQMMQAMNQPEGPDPEMKQLNGMLEKILDIQHPDRVEDRMSEASAKKEGQVFAVSAGPPMLAVSSLDSRQTSSAQQNGFYSLDNPDQVSQSMNAIPAVIYETQTIVNGSTVKLRLLNDIYIDGVLIPRNNFLFGEASLAGERLKIEIKGIRYQNALFPVQLLVYDLDGMSGIYIPGAITRDAIKQSADRAVQSIGITSLNPSLGAQAASAGIEAASNLLGKKIKLVKMTVKAGYRVLLKDDKQKQPG